MKNIFISILNWNDAQSTIICVDEVRKSIVQDGCKITLLVIDNGSEEADIAKLRSGIDSTNARLIFLPSNTGFAAGHNIAIKSALSQNADAIWILNNDAVVSSDTLQSLIEVLTQYRSCGMVSPLIYAHDDEDRIDFVGAIQDWNLLDSKRAQDPEIGMFMQENHPSKFFVYGTAPLIRSKALVEIGFLNEDYFAYYEDEEFCARLSEKNWTSRIAINTRIKHFRRRQIFEERPAYFFYLMARNSVFFYNRHTPKEFRRLIKLRLFSRAVIKAAKLREARYEDKCNACLLGIIDGLRSEGGSPRLDRNPPIWLTIASKIFPYRLHQLID